MCFDLCCVGAGVFLLWSMPLPEKTNCSAVRVSVLANISLVVVSPSAMQDEIDVARTLQPAMHWRTRKTLQNIASRRWDPCRLCALPLVTHLLMHVLG